MNKSEVIRKIIEALRSEFETYIRAAKFSYAEATAEENRAENKYDTRGLEASYLAAGQANKVAEIERVDAALPAILSLKPDVLIVTGDHSTPAVARTHTSHPVPFLIRSAAVRPDSTIEFNEQACATSAWGILPATALLPIATSYAGKRRRVGA